ncbi:rare lipoprotein A [Noviherbaspirillum humi]|uniref:Endolytic peptidoglycan transglycosylase RlpA n=1 Tax=Noviherbaspirillum humi TaxID=1688639 RepID=A0A239CDH2_9BURK|nr:septal ring lytic transglycosylase RlpA family protein [Noviherbaspirillum humi]SNS17413.1 rare lipoprotein A [Noviherbaspirillum humi]
MPLRIQHRNSHVLAISLSAALLAACGTPPQAPTQSADAAGAIKGGKPSSPIPSLPRAGSGRGGYYQDDGPGDVIPDGLMDVPDAEPKVEPYSRAALRPYNVFGVNYTPISDDRPFKQRGIGSWYGKKFHGQKTSSGEPYDMYKMTAAHPTLPIPSYARVTNLSNGRQVIVRVNDRGPFHSSRIIDLSFTAALKLGYLGSGSGQLEVERILPEEIRRMEAARANGIKLAASQPVPPNSPAAAVATASNGPVTVFSVEPAAVGGITTTPLPVAYGGSLGANAGDAAQPAQVAVKADGPEPEKTSGFYLQMGAFSQPANAEAARTRLEPAWAGRLPPMQVVQKDGMHRVYAGPFASRDEAQAAARRVLEAGAGRPMVVQR